MLSYMVGIAEASQLDSLHVVLPPEAFAPARHKLVEAMPKVVAQDCKDGMSASLRAGMMAVPPEAEGVMVLLADMPEIQTEHINQLIAQFQPNRIVRAVTEDGISGHPVLFAKTYFADLAALTGDVGAKTILRLAQDQIVDVTISGQAATLDLDTPEDWAHWRAKTSRQEF